MKKRRSSAAWKLGASMAAGAVLFGGCISTREVRETRRIHVESTPEGAYVEESDARGSRSIGRAPLDAEVEYVRTYNDFDEWSWLGLAIVGGAGGAALYEGITTDSSSLKGIVYAGALLGGLYFLLGVPVCIVGQSTDGDPSGGYYAHEAPRFKATLPGHTEAIVNLDAKEPPPESPVTLALQPTGGGEEGEANVYGLLGALGSSGGQLALHAEERPVVAVFDLDGSDLQLDARTQSQLGEHFATRLAELGRFRIVPRSEMRKRLLDAKNQTYRECFDESCQIELGKALAAAKTVVSKVLKINRRCTLSATVFDLKSETAETAASISVACSADALVPALDEVSEKLSR